MTYLMEPGASAGGVPPAKPSAQPPLCEAVASLGKYHEIASPLDDVYLLLRRLWRYRMQSHVREIMRGIKRTNGYEERVVYCMRIVIPGMAGSRDYGGPELWVKGSTAQYVGLVVCGSVWLCPVCAARVSEQRRNELVLGVGRWIDRGGEVVLLSQTAPHHRDDSLQGLLDRFVKARVLMHHRKPWNRWKDRTHLAGSVRALEVTYGFKNGFHVNVHEILFFEDQFQTDDSGELVERDLHQVHVALFYMWRDACASVGLGEPNFRRGIHVQDGRLAAGYASKWGIESELTKSHLKHARGGNFGPFDMVEEYSKGRLAFGPLFREYAAAFKNRKQLHWSDGMRSLVDLGEEGADGELAKKVEDGSEFLGTLTREQWARVVAAEKRGELLEVAWAEGWRGVLDFIGGLL